MHVSFGKVPLWILALGLLSSIALSSIAIAQSDPKAVDAVRAAVNSQMAADHNDHSNWIYNDHDVTESHNNMNACVGSPQGEICRTVKRYGVPLNSAEEQAESRRIADYVHDTSAQARAHKNQAHDDVQATE
jgi:hypothetical protein